jgi:hypothetical protein
MKKAGVLSLLFVVVLLAVAVIADAQQPKNVFPGEAQARFVVTICLSVCKKYKIVQNVRFSPSMHFGWSESALILGLGWHVSCYEISCGSAAVEMPRP